MSKVVTWSVVLDSSANGKLYVSPIPLARFEENAGKTNTSCASRATRPTASSAPRQRSGSRHS